MADMTKTVTRLISQFKPDNYQLSLTPNAETMTFTGYVLIKGHKTGRPSKRLTFHQNGLTITKATITHHDKKGDQTITVDRINHHKGLLEVRLHATHLLYPGSYTVELEFKSKITPDMNGLYPCYFTHEGVQHTLLMTQFESHFARDTFPCIDEPAAKATFDLTLVTEANKTVLANTPIKTQTSRDGITTTTFTTTPKMSSYLLAFVIGDLHSKHTTTKNGTEVGIWGTIEQPADSFDFALDVAKRSVEFLEDYFGVAYPLPKIDHVAVPDFSSGAMENWGLVTYREVALLSYPEESSQSAKELIATVICHETSHMWFGDLVTMQWWNDLWLNESFANMMEYRVVDALFPEWNIWNTFYGQEGLSALRRDAIPGVQAIMTDVNHPDEINTLFDPSIVYAKGGRLLYMLKNYIGDDAFRSGLTTYFNKHAFGNTTGDDLWSALSKASGKDIASFMNPWLERAGFPVLIVDQKGAQLTLRQEHFLDTPEKVENGRTWPVPLFAERDDIPPLFETAEQVITLDSDDYVFLDHGATGHYLVQYVQPEHFVAITEHVESGKTSEVDRLMLLNTSVMLARAGYSSFDDALKLLRAYKHENTDSVWDMMAVTLGDTRRFADLDERIETPLKKLTANLIIDQYARLGWDELPNESAADTKLRATIIGLGSYADVPAIVKKGIELYHAYQTDTDAVQSELRGLVFGIAVKHDEPDVVDYLLDLHQTTTNSDLKRDISSALTITKSPEVAKRLLGLVQDANIIKPQDADRWIAQLLRNHHTRSIAWQWMVDNWSWIDEVYSRDKSFDYFPRYAASVCSTPEWQQKFNDLFADKADLLILRRNILIGQEEIAARVKWLQKDLSAVQKYFGL